MEVSVREIADLVDAFCIEHLNSEYAEFCRRLTENLTRKRPTPPVNGKPSTWACGMSARLDSLDDSSRTPYMKLTAIDKAFGVAESKGQGKSKLIRTLFKIRPMDPAWNSDSKFRSIVGETSIQSASARWRQPAVANCQRLFLSSANLTQQAFTINMELGMLVHGGTMPECVERQFAKLIETGILNAI